MELEAVLNDNYELDYYEVKQKKGTITKHITVNPDNDYFDIKEVVYNGTKVIYSNEFIIDNELLNAINDIRK
ncbi:TPA: hypothetical protein ACKOP2_004097 [Clostridioides difficile]